MITKETNFMTIYKKVADTFCNIRADSLEAILDELEPEICVYYKESHDNNSDLALVLEKKNNILNCYSFISNR